MFLIVIAFLCLTIYYYIYTSSIERRYKFSTPFKIPFIGNAYLYFLLRNKDTVLSLGGKNKDLLKKRMYFWVGPTLQLLLLDPEDIAVVIKSSKKMRKAYQYRFLEPWLGDSILLSIGLKFQQHKKILVQSFHVNNLKDYMKIYNNSARSLVENISSVLGPDEFDIREYLSLCTMHTFLETTLGLDSSLIGNDARIYANAIEKLGRYVYIRSSVPWMYPDFIYNLLPLKKKQDKCVRTIHELTDRIIEEKRNNYERRKNEANIRKSFLEHLLSAVKDNGEKLSEKEIKDEVLVMLFAGQDTTTTSLGFVLTVLGMFEDIQDKVVAELREVLGDSDRPVTYEDICNLKYMEQVMNESWRMFPPFPMIGKNTLEDVSLGDSVIPKGTNIAIPIMCLHRNNTIYENPKKFNPENFSQQEMNKRNPLNFIPFSSGYRACIGQKYSTIFIKVILATVLRTYRIRCSTKLEDIRLYLQMTLSRKDGFRLSMDYREKNYKQ